MAETRTTFADWAPASHASTPAAFPPHPPLQSGGWYHGATAEAPGPGRPPVIPPVTKSPGVAVGLAVLGGPLGLCYLNVNAGLVATVLTVAVLGFVGSFLPLLVVWPLAVALAVRGVRR
jgi:hypothetical protein